MGGFGKSVRTTTDYCLQQLLEPVKATAKKRGSMKAAASNIIDLPPSKLNNLHHYVHGTWQHGGLVFCTLFARCWHECCTICTFMKLLRLKRLSKRGCRCQGLHHSQFAALEICHNNKMVRLAE
ncbi:PREDICTED: uncharacterized protein LOC103326924 [Prunus mume]|uniref:Uncharacterized protein LOC103326924 n=1 Tax=Prunus mume TaxID=102107 RepID=A0ABM0NNE7_PRUMU|nr:PREDICTED: uncharacterized protein LOC103326924 [Prunus mume]